MEINRRDLLRGLAASGALASLPNSLFAARDLVPVAVDNPLAHYPDRDWEKVYLDQYSYDGSFTYVCSPNDTHACRVRAFVRNGVVVRVEQNYDVQRYADPQGNTATRAWNPRMCLKGYTFPRRVYGPHRLMYPLIRKGWREWADDGFPELNAALRTKYRFDSRGQDKLERTSWDEASTYIAKGLVAIATRYSGETGARLLEEQGYPPEMIEDMGGSGTRCLKFRGGMGLLGVFGKYGLYRLNNSMAYLDETIRKVPQEEARGGRNFSNYTWHGDQAPGHPWVHGLQTSDCDFNDMRFSKLIIFAGKNMVENAMPGAHWMIECMERGAKIVVIAPEYGPHSTKADYWLPIRPSTDQALYLGITRLMIDKKLYDVEFIKNFTDFPLLVRTDNLRRLRASDIFEGYNNQDISQGPSFKVQGLTPEQREQIGDFVVWDQGKGAAVAITRDDIGTVFAKKRIDPALEGKFKVRTVEGKTVEVMPLFEMYKIHLKDYDLDTVHEITRTPKELIKRLAQDIGTIKPVAIHQGEGVNHWFHATEANRASYLPLMLTGNIGQPGSGSHTWAGNYKAANFQGSKWTGPGFKGWVAEDPFNLNLDPKAHGRDIKVSGRCKSEEPAYWNHCVDRKDTPLKGDYPLIVHTPKAGRKVFTGKTHMPTPSKVIFFNNVNLLQNAKHAYAMFKNVNPLVEMIISADIGMTASVEYADFGLPANSWMEFEGLEVTSSCSNPFLQIWKGGIKPVHDSKDDIDILALIAKKMSEVTGDERFAEMFKFVLEGKREVYMQRMLETSTTTADYKLSDIMAGKYGEPGAALMLFRTYPRIPFWEQVHDSIPFYTDHGRIQAYTDVPEAIEYGENFVIHREGPEATEYLPNVIVSTNPYVRPDSYGIPETAEDWDERTVRNIKKSWTDAKKSKNFLWEKGYRFLLLTPKTRHRVHSQWSDVDWNLIWNNNFGDPYRMDKRCPGVGEHQVHINPQAAKDLGIEDGDYVFVDANPADRPYMGWKPSDPYYRVARCMLRAKYNPAYPYNVLMMKHAPFIATERSVKAHESRADGLAVSEDTGYQANFRYGSQQSCTRNWHMPMHQTDTLFHKKKAYMSLFFGGEADNHALNTVPKETLVKVVKAEDGGLGGKGVWAPAATGLTPGHEDKWMESYLAGELTKVRG